MFTQIKVPLINETSAQQKIDITDEINKIWQLSCQLYQFKQTQTLCLQWQNEHNLNVNLLLILALYQSQNITFHPNVLNTTIKQTELFSQQHTQLIRQVRTSLKQQVSAVDYAELKSKLLAAELSCEQQEQKQIMTLLLLKSEASFLSKNNPSHNTNITDCLNYYFIQKQTNISPTELLQLATDFMQTVK